MKLIGMLPVRNEAWCLGLSLRVALMWCDEVVVLLHACTDRSEEIAVNIARENDGRVTVVGKDGEWQEMIHRQAMLELARDRGATHLAIIDADEVLSGSLQHGFTSPMEPSIIRCMVASTQPDHILQLPGYNLRDPSSAGYFPPVYKTDQHGLRNYHSNGIWANRWFSVAFADDPALSWSGDRFHHREPQGKKLTPYQPIQQGQGGVMHLWSSSLKRLHEKHRLYRLTERLRWPDKPVAEIERMYSWAEKGDPSNAAYGTPETWTYAPVPESWWKPYQGLLKYLDIDSEPWQKAECERIIAQYGRDHFKGLSID